MEQVQCQQCRMPNPATSSFCSRCGAALGAQPAGASSASGWELATAGMAQPPAPQAEAGVLRKEELAGWWRRLGAYILDTIIVLVLLGIIAAVLVASGMLEWSQLDSDPNPNNYRYNLMYQGENGGVLIVAWLLLAAWDVAWTRSSTMAKPGQLAAGFRVAKVEPLQPLTTGRAVARAAAKLLYNVPVVGPLLFIASAFTIGLSEKKQGLHEMVAGTVSVRKPALAQRGIGPDAANASSGLPTAHHQRLP